uniref:Uncharacterized protein n=1 Tax=Rhizophora mucronata TaxID=61149 RepID=A0A2P2K445_RHIMU
MGRVASLKVTSPFKALLHGHFKNHFSFSLLSYPSNFLPLAGQSSCLCPSFCRLHSCKARFWISEFWDSFVFGLFDGMRSWE